MAKLDRFEDFEIWKHARLIMNRVYDMSSIGEFARDYALKGQIRDAVISIMSNIGEGHERDGNKERINFLSYAKGSTGEVRCQLYVALDIKYITQKEFDELYAMLMAESRMLSGLMNYLKKSAFKGRKYKEDDGR
ncbi:MAG: four helix bundle protein [Spirochaetia bacterium]|nr:four helix bundle protein [Spirochaetia bacterium]